MRVELSITGKVVDEIVLPLAVNDGKSTIKAQSLGRMSPLLLPYHELLSNLVLDHLKIFESDLMRRQNQSVFVWHISVHLHFTHLAQRPFAPSHPDKARTVFRNHHM
jgi:hypothetical protein